MKVIIPANGSFPVKAAGDKVHCFSATANCKIQFSWSDGSVSSQFNFGATMQYGTKGKKFNGLNFYNNTGTDITLELIILNDDIDVIDNRVSIETFSVTQDADSNPWIVQSELLSFVEGDNSITVTTVEMPLMAAALNKKNRITIQNGSGSYALFIGPTGVTSDNGIYVGKSERVVLENVAQRLYAIRSSGSGDVYSNVYEAQ